MSPAMHVGLNKTPCLCWSNNLIELHKAATDLILLHPILPVLFVDLFYCFIPSPQSCRTFGTTNLARSGCSAQL